MGSEELKNLEKQVTPWIEKRLTYGGIILNKKLLIILTAFVLLAGWNLWPEKVKEVEVYKMASFSSMKEETKITFSDQRTVKAFKRAFKRARKQPGAVDMVDPDYKIILGEEIYFLWIDKKHGTIMNLEDTNTIYTLSWWSAVRVGGLLDIQE
ncbi:hypothetical protein [Bacillus infantis]|uniref:YhfM-like domain-containing protein n=1 Tax=Bacillus infantis TaxID=324767 RepID=A0A5D4QVB9_9BACI|nr:hypothetical protein [Bacillus infantis]TYS41906.1 hypothetical protein FZD51_23595 [Bacillus infantis]